MIKKLFIIPWAGEFPKWMQSYLENTAELDDYGYEFLFTRDMEDFSSRVERVLGFLPVIQPGSSLLHNYRAAFGLLYADVLQGYDFWGITDLDCVYGDVLSFIPDETLSKLDIHSNHHNYICGPWTLFRNNETVNNLFKLVPQWEGLMRSTDRQAGRWTEVEYSQVVDAQHDAGAIKRLYTHYQGKDPDVYENVTFKDGKLYDGEEEIMMFHFNRNKVWPL